MTFIPHSVHCFFYVNITDFDDDDVSIIVLFLYMSTCECILRVFGEFYCCFCLHLR